MPAKNCPALSHRQLALIWEVYARIGLRPEQAVHLLRRQGRHVTPSQAKGYICQAGRRNTLRLVFYKAGM